MKTLDPGWMRRVAAGIAAAHPLGAERARPARATGNHLAAQNDEQERCPRTKQGEFNPLRCCRTAGHEGPCNWVVSGPAYKSPSCKHGHGFKCRICWPRG